MQDVAAAALYLATKPSSHTISPRLLLTVVDFLAEISPDYSRALGDQAPSWTFTEGKYELARAELFAIEAHMLRSLGFQIHVALPQTLCINYLQTLDVFITPEGSRVAKRTIELLNTALFSSQLLYLTHQPNTLAVSAIYLAARQLRFKLPETEWWEVFDVDREDLGFVVVAMQSVKDAIAEETMEHRIHGSLLTIEAVTLELKRQRG